MGSFMLVMGQNTLKIANHKLSLPSFKLYLDKKKSACSFSFTPFFLIKILVVVKTTAELETMNEFIFRCFQSKNDLKTGFEKIEFNYDGKSPFCFFVFV